MTKSPFRVGLVGWGLGGQYFHAPFIQATAGLELVAIATSRPVDHTIYPQVRRLSDLDALLADQTIDLVVIASPNQLHVPQALATLTAGKHVVLEKPLAETAVQLQHLLTTAQHAHRLLIPFQNRRWDGDFRTVRQLVQSGNLGHIYYYESHWEKYQPIPKTRSGWKATGGRLTGLLYDLGPHLIDQAICLFGPPTHVYAQIAQQRPSTPADDLLRLNVQFGGGVHALLEVDMLNPFPVPRFHLRGSQGAFTKYGLDPQEARLTTGERPQDESWGHEPAANWGTLIQGNGRQQPIPTLPGDYRLFYQGVVQALHGHPLPIDPTDILWQLRLIAAALESAQTGACIRLVQS